MQEKVAFYTDQLEKSTVDDADKEKLMGNRKRLMDRLFDEDEELLSKAARPNRTL